MTKDTPLPADASPRRSDDELLATVHQRVATIRATRARRTFLALGVATAATLLVATGVAVAGNGGEKQTAKVSSVASTTTSTQATTTTSLPDETTTTEVTSTTTTVGPVSAPPTTTKPVVSQATPRTTISRSGTVAPNALLVEVWPPNRNTARVYVSARGGATNGYVTHMTLTWGDTSPPLTFDYAPATCQDPNTAHPNDVQVADANHGYATTGTYTVQLVVQATRCDGREGQAATSSITVRYPSAPPSS